VKYRADIDGLRAIAVLSVMAFHVNSKVLSGGFVGVDVFFVISGYLISGIVMSEIDDEKFSFLSFYDRRLRRIFPALFAMLTATMIVASILSVPNIFVTVVNSALSAAVSLSNVYFFKTSGYFDLGSNDRPLLHTWSLAVEEQFYILIPPVFLFARHFLRLHWVAVILPLGFLSLGIDVFQTWHAPTAAFYLPFSRSWEFLLGSALAARLPPAPAKIFAEVCGIAGLALLAVSLVVLGQSMPFPGWIAIIPCFGAALIIYAGEFGLSLVGRLLSLPLMRAIGLISYSLYLWHWPAIVFSRLFWGGTFSPIQSMALLLGIFVVSWLSWKYIEQPFRRNRLIFTRKRLFAGTFALLGAFFALRFEVNQLHGVPQRFNPTELTLLTDDTAPSYACDAAWPADQSCIIGNANSPISFAMIGDSFGAALSAGLDDVARIKSRRGMTFNKGGCYPLLDVQLDSDACTTFMRDAIRRVSMMPEIKSVVLIGRWASAVENQRLGSENRATGFLRDASTHQTSLEENSRVLTRGVARTISALVGRKLFVVAHVPEQHVNVPQAAVVRLRLGQDDLISIPLASFEQREARTRKLTELWETDQHISILDASTIFCDTRVCSATGNGRSFYFDDNHLSIYGSKLLAREGFYDRFFASIR
jgi:peptidoglycan/LPS O-acetylase OafA/YrhL